jgi:uncharacterized delta-60 repeat protein
LVEIGLRRGRRLLGFVVAVGLVFAVLFGLNRLALGGVSSTANLRLAGSLDSSFGSDGVVTHSLGGNAAQRFGGIALQPDGKIVAVASGSVIRYQPDGSLDSSFGDGGYAATGLEAYAVALQSDGKIVVAGTNAPGPTGTGIAFAVARFNPDGSPDVSFGTDGMTTTIIPESTPCGGLSGAAAGALAVLPGGDILAVGSAWWDDCDTSPASQVALVRYTLSGSLDPTFGAAGIVRASMSSLGGIVVQPDGRILVSGSVVSCCHGGLDGAYMVLARYESDGSLDRSFGVGGTATTQWLGSNFYYIGGPAVLDGGKILVAGASTKDGTTWLPVLAGFAPQEGGGDVYPIARIRGVATAPSGPTAMVAQSDGKILITSSSAVVRIRPSGRLDPSFGNGGIVLSGYESSALALQTDGKVLVGGGSGNVWTITRLLGGNNCVVPSLYDKTISQVTTTLTKSYCVRGRTTKRFSSKVTRGRVISTAPPRSARLPGGAKINLVVSKGKRP